MAYAKFAKCPGVSGIVRAAMLSGAIYGGLALTAVTAAHAEGGNMFTDVS